MGSSLDEALKENLTSTQMYVIGNNSISGEVTLNITTTIGTAVANATSNGTDSEALGANAPPFWAKVIIIIVLGSLTLGTIIGNTLVCTAVGIVKRLQTPSNLLIVSLALSDLLVAVLVMPLAIVLEVTGYWPFDEMLCNLWTSFDVIMCTASILNLCMISVDRYLVITRPFQYAIKRTPRVMALMITGVWVVAVIISVPPLFGWKTDNGPYACLISQNIYYQIYATLGAFYLPLIVMIVIYFRIWLVSSRLAKNERHTKVGSFDRGNGIAVSTRSSAASGDHLHLPNGSLVNGYGEQDAAATEMLPQRPVHSQRRRFTIKSLISRTSKSSTGSSKERKATKTLGIIMGGFTLCWLPFFILALIRPFVSEDDIPPLLSSILMWLGYFNSFMNPVIYARFNREFRTPFKEILCFRCRGINVRLRSESYVEQYGPDRDRDRDRDRDSLRPPQDSVVRYNSQGQTVVQVRNGNSKTMGESKI